MAWVGRSWPSTLTDWRSLASRGKRVVITLLQIVAACVRMKIRRHFDVWTRSRRDDVGIWEMIFRRSSIGRVVRKLWFWGNIFGEYV